MTRIVLLEMMVSMLLKSNTSSSQDNAKRAMVAAWIDGEALQLS
jgi:hypothetical protein